MPRLQTKPPRRNMVVTILGFKTLEDDRASYNSPFRLEPLYGGFESVVKEYFMVEQRWPHVAMRRFVRSIFKGIDDSYTALRGVSVFAIVYDEQRRNVHVYKTRQRVFGDGHIGLTSPIAYAKYSGVETMKDFKDLPVMRGHANLLKEYIRTYHGSSSN